MDSPLTGELSFNCGTGWEADDRQSRSPALKYERGFRVRGNIVRNWLAFAVKATLIFIGFVVVATLFLAVWVTFIQPTTKPIIDAIVGAISVVLFWLFVAPLIWISIAARYIYTAFPAVGVTAIAAVALLVVMKPLVYWIRPVVRSRQQFEKVLKLSRDRHLGLCDWQIGWTPDTVGTTTASLCRYMDPIRGHEGHDDEERISAIGIRTWDQEAKAFKETLLIRGSVQGYHFKYAERFHPRHVAPSSILLDMGFGGVAEGLSDAFSADLLAKSIVEEGAQQSADASKVRQSRLQFCGIPWTHYVSIRVQSNDDLLEHNIVYGKTEGNDPTAKTLGAEEVRDLAKLEGALQAVGLPSRQELGQSHHSGAMPLHASQKLPKWIFRRYFRVDVFGRIFDVSNATQRLADEAILHSWRLAAAASMAAAAALFLNGKYGQPNGDFVPKLVAQEETRKSALDTFWLRQASLLNLGMRYPRSEGVRLLDRGTHHVRERPNGKIIETLEKGAIARRIYVYYRLKDWVFADFGKVRGWIEQAHLSEVRSREKEVSDPLPASDAVSRGHNESRPMFEPKADRRKPIVTPSINRPENADSALAEPPWRVVNGSAVAKSRSERVFFVVECISTGLAIRILAQGRINWASGNALVKVDSVGFPMLVDGGSDYILLSNRANNEIGISDELVAALMKGSRLELAGSAVRNMPGQDQIFFSRVRLLPYLPFAISAPDPFVPAPKP